MLPTVWTFPGVQSIKDLAAGCSADSHWQKTTNGWPDSVTFQLWGKLMVAEKNRRNLSKVLIYVDNAHVHADLELCAMLAKDEVHEVHAQSAAHVVGDVAGRMGGESAEALEGVQEEALIAIQVTQRRWRGGGRELDVSSCRS